PRPALVALIGLAPQRVPCVQPVLEFLGQALQEAEVGHWDDRRQFLATPSDDDSLLSIRDPVDEFREVPTRVARCHPTHMPFRLPYRPRPSGAALVCFRQSSTGVKGALGTFCKKWAP